MRKPVALFAVLLATAALSGCGTLFNLAGCEMEHCLIGPPSRETTPFGGLEVDARYMALGTPPEEWNWLIVALAAADMPLSLAGDIITLPYTVPHWLMHGVGQPAATEPQRQTHAVPQPDANGQYQFSDLHFVIDPPSPGTPERLHGGIGPGY